MLLTCFCSSGSGLFMFMGWPDAGGEQLFNLCLLHHAPVWLCATCYFMTVKALPEDRLPHFLMDTLMPFTVI